MADNPPQFPSKETPFRNAQILVEKLAESTAPSAQLETAISFIGDDQFDEIVIFAVSRAWLNYRSGPVNQESIERLNALESHWHPGSKSKAREFLSALRDELSGMKPMEQRTALGYAALLLQLKDRYPDKHPDEGLALLRAELLQARMKTKAHGH